MTYVCSRSALLPCPPSCWGPRCRLIDGHYGFIGYANTTFDTGGGTVIVTLSSHPGAEMRITT